LVSSDWERAETGSHSSSPERSVGNAPDVLGLADELGLVLAEGLSDDDAEDEGD